MKLGLFTALFSDLTLDEVISRIRPLGIQALALVESRSEPIGKVAVHSCRVGGLGKAMLAALSRRGQSTRFNG